MGKTEKNPEGELSFLDHLEILRWHLIRSSAAILVGTIVLFSSKSFLFDKVILGAKNPEFITYQWLCALSQSFGASYFCIDSMPFEIINVNMSGQFTTHLWVSLIGGIVIAFPYILWEIWRFIKPGLKPEERKNSRGAVAVGSFLFMMGVLFGYYLISPLSIQFLGTYQVSAEVSNTIHLGSFISTITTVTLASGLIFELPLMVYFLSRLGILTSAGMKTYRRHSYVGVLILSAIITPPDISSQILVSIPLVVLYEISIRIAKRVEKKKEKALKKK